MSDRSIRMSCLLLTAVLGLSARGASAQGTKPATRVGGLDFSTLPRPGEKDFILDLAELIPPEDETKIRQQCEKLLKEKATPIIVVTIQSMAAHGGAGMRIETFAMLLFNQWQVGHAKLGDQQWNTGILLLVSQDDRKARIELGAGWGRREDALCQQIMDTYIVANFKQDKYPAGILAGVDALDKMARKLELPAPPKVVRPWWHYALIAGFIGLAIFTVISLVRRGSGGWAWVFWAAAFALVGYLLYSFLTRGSRGGGGGGFGGGSFGGGFSGGGGASGSW